MTTKEQERKALAQIKAIIDELGENSYIGTAFAGCVQDAENNIDEDAAYSYKDRYEYMANEREQERTKRKAAEKALAEAKADLEEAKMLTLSDGDRRTFLNLVGIEEQHIQSKIDEKNQIIIDHAETPEDKEFQNAVYTRKQEMTLLNAYRELQTRIEDTL